MRTIQQIAEDLRTQDNRCTSDPMFCVQMLVREVGYDAAYSGQRCWHDSANDETIYDDDPDFKWYQGRLMCFAADGRSDHRWDEIGCTYGEPGDRLWVREAFRSDGETILYRAGGELSPAPIEINAGFIEESDGWRPSIHMPRWASRITLEIQSVRVERVQDISQEDAKAEGVELSSAVASFVCDTPSMRRQFKSAYVSAFCDLWNSINESRGFGWAVNPWVWVIEFKRV